MKKELYTQIKLPASRINFNTKLGFVDTLACLQDNMCEYFKILGCDGITMLPVCNAFFVITKTLIKFVGNADWLDVVELRTCVTKKSNIRVNLGNDIYKNGKPIVFGLQEMCAVDADTRKLRTVDTTLFPQDIEINNDTGNSNMAFSKLMEEFTEEDFIKEIVIDASHLDFYKHTNNVEYAKFILSTMLLDEIENKEIDTFEIHYINQCVVGDKLRIYKKTIGDEVFHQMILSDGILANKSKLKFKK